MNRRQFNRALKISTEEEGNKFSVMAAITLFSQESDTRGVPDETVGEEDDYIHHALVRVRTSIADQMYGDIRELLFALQRSMLKSRLGVDEKSVTLLRSILEYMPDGSFYVAADPKDFVNE